MGNINIINSITNRQISSNMTLEGLVDFIKNPNSPHVPFINSARSFGKGSVAYDSIKKNNIPCAILNFNHSKGYVKGNTVSKPTGYLYIDVDNSLDVDLSSDHISAYWKSLSGTGYSIVVAVKGLTKSNYKSATMEVSDLLGLPLDKGAISIDRVTCISYDPDAYYNPNAVVYHIQTTSNEENYHTVLTNTNSLYGLGLYDSFSKTKVRVSTIEDLYKGIDFNGEPVHDLGTGGMPYADIHFNIRGVSKGNRNVAMYSTIQQLRAMNPWMHKDRVVAYINGINKKAFKPMLSKVELNSIIESAFKEKNPKLLMNRTRRFLYNPDYDLTTRDKRSIAIKELNRVRVGNTDMKIRSVLECWDFSKNGKITLKKIANIAGISIPTVNRRGKQLKEIIKEKNLGFKGNI